MNKNLVQYNHGKNIQNFDLPVRVVSYIDQAQTSIEVKYCAANVRGLFRQAEADMILEEELGLSPRRKK